MSPTVSVVMPVYNAQKYLGEAVDSILSQTFSDFELIILNDGSADSSHAILSEYEAKDARIVYKNFARNRGLPSVLNDGIRISQGKYIARMDQDDISLPTRLQDQVCWMDAHPQVDICGAWVELIGAAQGRMLQLPVDHASIHARMLFSNAIAHPTVMMRMSSVRKHGLMYDEERIYIEDYDLWSRVLEKMQFANLDKILLRYRIHEENTVHKHGEEQRYTRKHIYQRLLNPLGVEPSMEELLVHEKISEGSFGNGFSFLKMTHSWLMKLREANRKRDVVDGKAFDGELGRRWTKVCNASNVNVFSVGAAVLVTPLPFYGEHGFRKLKPLAKYVLRRLWNGLVKRRREVAG